MLNFIISLKKFLCKTMYNTLYLRIYHTEIDNIRQCIKCDTKKCNVHLILLKHIMPISVTLHFLTVGPLKQNYWFFLPD